MTGVRFSHFGPPFFRPEFAADFFKTFCTFNHFGAPFGKPFGSLWLEHGGPENGRKKNGKKELQGLATQYARDLLAPKEEVFDPLLPHRLEEYAIGSNTPCVPEGTVADIYT